MADTIQKVASINSSIKLELGDSLRKLKLFKKELKSVKQMLDKMPSKTKVTQTTGGKLPSHLRQERRKELKAKDTLLADMLKKEDIALKKSERQKSQAKASMLMEEDKLIKQSLDSKRKATQEELKDLKFVNKQEKINARERKKINDRVSRLTSSGSRRASFVGIDPESASGKRIQALQQELRANAKTSRSYRDLAKHVDRYNQELNQVIGTHKRMTASSQSTAAKLNRLRTGFLALTAAATPFALGQGVVEIGQTVEKLGLGLSVSFGEETQAQMQTFNRIVDETGVNLSAAAKSYRNFMVSAKETGFSVDEAESTFKTFSKAAVVMGMSAEDTEGSLKALVQMIG